MDRKKLLEAFASVDPARSKLPANAVMKCFWITGKRVMAYDGNMALSVPFESEWQGAIQDTVFPLLASSGAPECTIEDTDKGTVVKAGASKFKLLTMSNNEFNFRMPKWPDDAAFPVADVPKFLMALKACKRSLGSEVSAACFKGVTLVPGKTKLTMTAYDRLTLTKATCVTKRELDFTRAVIPTAAVDQLIRITEGATKLSMVIDGKTMLARSNGVTLWARCVDEEGTERDFLEYAKAYDAEAQSTISLDDKDFQRKFPAMLERASIITKGNTEATKTKCSVAEGKIFLQSKSARGIVDDGIMVPKGQKHHDVQLRLDPKRVLDALELGSLSFTKSATILSNYDRSIVYYVSGE